MKDNVTPVSNPKVILYLNPLRLTIENKEELEKENQLGYFIFWVKILHRFFYFQIS